MGRQKKETLRVANPLMDLDGGGSSDDSETDDDVPSDVPSFVPADVPADIDVPVDVDVLADDEAAGSPVAEDSGTDSSESGGGGGGSGSSWLSKSHHPWLLQKEQEQDAMKVRGGDPLFSYANGDPIPLDWCLIMSLDSKTKTERLPDEVREIVERLMGAGLYVWHHIGATRKSIYIQVGATLTSMLNEATHEMVLQMPVRGKMPARGTVPFHLELTADFQDPEEHAAGTEFRFHSGARQRIIMNMMTRIALVNPMQKTLAPNRLKLLSKMKHKAEVKQVGMQRWAVKELLEDNLCTTMTSMEAKTTMTFDEVGTLFERVDVSANGAIDFAELEAWAEELSQREHEAEKAGQAGDDPQEAAEGGRKAKRWWRRRKRN